MQVTTERPSPCELELKIEVEAGTVAQTIDEIYQEFSKSVNVPGFRKGKAPRQLLERFVSPESVRRRAVEILVPPAYHQALEENDIQPYADPDVEIVQLDMEQPFIFKATVPLPPRIELGEYRGIEVERPKVSVSDEDIDAQLKQLQEANATTQKVEGRGVQTGDLVIAEITSAVEGQEQGPTRRSLIQVGSNVPGFDNQILGMEPGQQRSFTVKYPDDFAEEELAGKNISFQVDVESISERHLPEINDEFVKSITDFETVGQLREDMKNRMTALAEESAEREAERKIVDEVVARSDIHFPDVLVEHEAHHDLEDLQKGLERRGISMEAYLRQTGKSEEELAADLREAATRRVRAGLALGEISERENIDVSDEEVEAQIAGMVSENTDATREVVETYIEARGGRPAIRNNLLNRKIMDFLKSISSIK